MIAWLLDHWNGSPPPHDSVVDAAQAQETLSSLERIFANVRSDPDLRARLGWANGPLAPGGGGQPFAPAIDWPDEFEMTLPIRGGLGFFLTEVLSNAMRHGAAARFHTSPFNATASSASSSSPSTTSAATIAHVRGASTAAWRC